MALPQTLGRLTLLRHLGSDTYTVSWLYHDPDRVTPVVVRALGDQWVQHPQARADFIGGTGPFQPISSPQHVTVLASGQAPDGTPYVVTPYAAEAQSSGASSGAPTLVGTPSPFAPPGRTPIDLAKSSPAQPAPPTVDMPTAPGSPAPTGPLPTASAPPAQPAAQPAAQPPAAWPSPTGAVPPGGTGPGMSGYGAWDPTPKRRLWPLFVGIATAIVLLAGAGVLAAVTIGGNNDKPSAASTPGPAGSSPSAQPSPTSPAPTSPAGPAGGASAVPTVGQCRDIADSMVPKQSDPTPAIACSQQHTAQTYYVGHYAGNMPDNTYAGTVCQKQLAAGLGISANQAALTAYQVLFFRPDNAAWAAGQRWFRCDVALLAGTHLLPLPTTLVPHPLPDSLRACLTQKGQRTPCSRTHVVRAFATYSLSGSKPPSAQKAEAQGRAECPGGSVYFTWPSSAEYQQGIRIGVCWSADAKSGSVPPGTST